MSPVEINEQQHARYDGQLMHIGTMDQSGRYVRGSGEDPYQHVRNYVALNGKLKKEIPVETERAKAMGFRTVSEYRKYSSVATGEKRNYDRAEAEKLKGRGWSNDKIAQKLGVSATKVSDLLKPREELKQSAREKAALAMQTQVDKYRYLDVGAGVESSMGITKDMKDKALYELQMKGYKVYNIHERTAIGNNNNTKVLTQPGVEFAEAKQNSHDIKPFVGKIDDFDRDMNPLGFKKPLAVDPKRLQVVYGGEGGEQADGMIYVRPGVDDISLGKNRYAQVRIQVGDEHFLKGMAAYKDDLPDGVDLQFMTPKAKTANKMDALKPLERNKLTGEIDENNPFGSVVKQIMDDDKNVISAMNIVNEDEGWDRWSKNLSSQFLSKQSIPLAKTQLELTRAKKTTELDKILSLENPVVRKHMLDKFADSADSAAEHLKAAQLPGQKTHVLLPIPSMKTNEVFAPNFENGDRVVLVRYPHGGTFEIPELVVNNKNKDALKIIGINSKTAIGIHADVAERLSGADFDGDTVVVIPNNQGRVSHRPPLKGLENFDAKTIYGPTKEDAAAFAAGKDPYPAMKKGNVNAQMGIISNLLTDMQIKGASDEEVARAAKHAMVVIDAHKHKLDYKRSYDENRIKDLKATYQTGGASTLISRARGEATVADRVLRKASEGGPIDPDTGALVYVPTGKKARAKDKVTGEWYETDNDKQIRITKMEATNDARTLSSGTAIEDLYADHANSMKSLANRARREMVHTPDPKVDYAAKAKYKKEVAELDEALRIAKQNAPKERHAQRVAAAMLAVRMDENPDMDKSDIKKIKGATLRTARELTGAGKTMIKPTDEQWEAIQAGAISTSKLRDILSNGDMERITELSMPREKVTVTASQEARIKAMSAANRTQAEIAAALGISTSTVNRYL